jgi:hypothetical protein
MSAEQENFNIIKKLSHYDDFTILSRQQLKVDITVGEEKLYYYPLLFVGIFLFSGHPIGYLIAGLLFVISIALFFGTDNYYIIDMDKFQIQYRRKVFSAEQIKIARRFDEVRTILVQGAYCKGSYGGIGPHSSYSWKYWLEVIDRNGAVLTITNRMKEHSQRVEQAKLLARLINCELIEGAIEREVHASGPPTDQAYHMEKEKPAYGKPFAFAVGITLGLMALFFVTMAIISK